MHPRFIFAVTSLRGIWGKHIHHLPSQASLFAFFFFCLYQITFARRSLSILSKETFSI